jgi:antitoxin CcdA
MRTHLFDRGAPRRRTNVSVNADLLEQAKELKVNLSAALEAKLIELLRVERERRWREENRDAIAEANTFIAKYGVFSDGLRRF